MKSVSPTLGKIVWTTCLVLIQVATLANSRFLDIERQRPLERRVRSASDGVVPELAALPFQQAWLSRDWTDPEITSTAMEIIKRWGYPVEQYNVTTEDGYILLLLRIPHGRHTNSTPTESRPVVYLQHGIESSCVDWIVNLPHQSAAFIYADNGFDVWMGNFRGNFYSMRHVKLSPSQHAFWRFSWDEMARYDLPALIGTTLNITGAPWVYYVGHSMGTTTIFAQLSQDANFAKLVKRVYALAPVSTVSHFKGPIHYLAPFARVIEFLLSRIFGVDDIFPTTALQQKIARYLCGSVITELFCTNLVMLVTGPESRQMNTTRMPVYVAHTPSGTSTRTVAQFAQVHNAKKFQMYDYGTKSKNQENYHQNTPPVYDVTKIQTPITLYWGGQDWLADSLDVEELTPKLHNLVGNVYFKDYNHVDFIWGLRAASEIYIPIYKDILEDFYKFYAYVL